MEKGVDKSLRGRYNSKAVGRERQASETEVRAEGVRTEVSSASESRGRQPGERTEVLEPDVP